MLIAVIPLSFAVGNLRYPCQGSQPPVQGRVIIAASLLMPLFYILMAKRWTLLLQVDFNIFLIQFWKYRIYFVFLQRKKCLFDEMQMI